MPASSQQERASADRAGEPELAICFWKRSSFFSSRASISSLTSAPAMQAFPRKPRRVCWKSRHKGGCSRQATNGVPQSSHNLYGPDLNSMLSIVCDFCARTQTESHKQLIFAAHRCPGATSASRRKSKLPDARSRTFVTRRVCTTSLFGYHSGIPGNSSARIRCTST
jgi:hypothetical protein